MQFPGGAFKAVKIAVQAVFLLPQAYFAHMMNCVKKTPGHESGVYVQGVCTVERMLQKIAKQLCGFDEASLMELWERYAKKVARFEPSREWEEAAIV